MSSKEAIVILMADDDADDRAMAKEALEESCFANPMYFVEDGAALMDYLNKRGRFSAPGLAPTPGLILLDLNMPKKDGREALAEIKADVHLRRIPVVVLTTSKTEEDVSQCYDLGASSFITKPVTFDALVNVARSLGQYWLELVTLPGHDEAYDAGRSS